MPTSVYPAEHPVTIQDGFTLPLRIVSEQVVALDKIATILATNLSKSDLLSETCIATHRTAITDMLSFRDALMSAEDAVGYRDQSRLLTGISEARIATDPNPPAFTEEEEFDLLIEQDIRFRTVLSELDRFNDTSLVAPDYQSVTSQLRTYVCQHIRSAKHIVQAYL
ncbi:MAG: hypothetical protein VYD08_04570 [Pseudomonadota bacterium]|nr:hypothetical protein [Pseudomonadota bacterium]